MLKIRSLFKIKYVNTLDTQALNIVNLRSEFGVIAQLVERLHGMQ